MQSPSVQADEDLLGAIFGLGDFNTSMDNLGQITAGDVTAD